MTFRLLVLAGAVLGVGALAGCESVPPELQPAQILRDSLGLTERDVVHEVGVRTVSGTEVATPARVTVTGPARLSFRSDDSRARRITTDTVALNAAQKDFARRFAQGSPPLVQLEARWVVDLTGAPQGRYLFHVIGSTGAGTVEVEVGAGD